LKPVSLQPAVELFRRRRGAWASLFELEAGPGRIAALEGLRGAAILLVFQVHFHVLFAPWIAIHPAVNAVSEFLHVIGHSGVDLFFLLSGYLIYSGVLSKAVPYGRFLHRRARRIYPAFHVVLVVYLTLFLALPERSKLPGGSAFETLWAVAVNALLLPGFFDMQPFITVSWSLSYEVVFYTLLPVLVHLTGMREWERRKRVLFWVVLAGMYLTACFAWGGGLFWEAIRLRPASHARMVFFTAGILLYEAHESGKLRSWLNPRREALTLAYLALAWAAYYWLGRFLDTADAGRIEAARTLVLAPALCALTGCALAVAGFWQQLFTGSALRWTGNISYSFYLTHSLALQGLALVATARVSPGWISLLGLSAAALALSYALAVALFLAVEKPVSLARPATVRLTAEQYSERENA